MTTLSVFSEKERAYFQYQARQEYLRVQAATRQRSEIAEQKQREAEQKLQEVEKEAKQKVQDAEQKAKEAEQKAADALLEIEKLKALLATADKLGE